MFMVIAVKARQTENKMRKNLAIIAVAVLILMAGFIVFGPKGPRLSEEIPAMPAEEEGKQVSSGRVSVKEKGLIDDWIVENDLNQYGDPKDMVYIGGTPLFNESSGERTDKYEYIFDNYPDKPWLE